MSCTRATSKPSRAKMRRGASISAWRVTKERSCFLPIGSVACVRDNFSAVPESMVSPLASHNKYIHACFYRLVNHGWTRVSGEGLNDFVEVYDKPARPRQIDRSLCFSGDSGGRYRMCEEPCCTADHGADASDGCECARGGCSFVRRVGRDNGRICERADSTAGFGLPRATTLSRRLSGAEGAGTLRD